MRCSSTIALDDVFLKDGRNCFDDIVTHLPRATANSEFFAIPTFLNNKHDNKSGSFFP